MSENPFMLDGEIPEYLAVEIVSDHSEDTVIEKIKATYSNYRWLAMSLDFTQEDLWHNTQGIITNSQRNILQEQGIKDAFLPQYVFRFSFLASIVTVLLSLSIGFLFCFATYFALGFAVFTYIKKEQILRPIRADIARGNTKSATGRVSLYTEDDKLRGKAYKVGIAGGGKFTTTHRAYLRFKHLEPYIIYYAPNSRIILSAMPLEEER